MYSVLVYVLQVRDMMDAILEGYPKKKKDFLVVTCNFGLLLPHVELSLVSGFFSFRRKSA